MRCRLEQLRGQFICIHSAAVAAAAALRVVITACCCFSFCYVDIVRGFTTEYLDLLLIDYNYNVRCCTTYEMYLYTCYVLFCCCSVVRCYIAAMLLLQLPLLAAVVRHRVPDGKICFRGSLHLIPVFYFSSFHYELFSMYPLAVLSHLQRRFVPSSIINIIHPR